MSMTPLSELLNAATPETRERVEFRVTMEKERRGLQLPPPLVFDPAPPKHTGVVHKVGSTVRIVQPRAVMRVGYRTTWKDYTDDARKLLMKVQGESETFRALASPIRPLDRELVRATARVIAGANHLGGPERGVHFRELPNSFVGQLYTVESRRNVRIGTYYAPSGSGEDYEEGGLTGAYTIVLLKLDCGFEVLASDVERAILFPYLSVEEVRAAYEKFKAR